MLVPQINLHSDTPTVILKVLNFMDASRCINKDFHAKEKKCQHNGSKSILEEPSYLDVTLSLQVAITWRWR